MTNPTQTQTLRSAIRAAKTEAEVMPLIREYLRRPDIHGVLDGGTVPMFYTYGFRDKAEFDQFIGESWGVQIYGSRDNEPGTITMDLKLFISIDL